MTDNTTTDLSLLQYTLHSRDETLREWAFQTALALPPEMLLRLVAVPARRAVVHAKIQEAIVTSGCLWLLACIVTMVAQFTYHAVYGWWDALLFLWIPVFAVVLNKIEARSQVYDQFCRMILRHNDARMVMPTLLLYRYLDSRSHHEHTEMREALLRLLPPLTLADVETWTPVHKTILRQQAFGTGNESGLWHDLEMMRCALQTLTRVGDATDIPAARRLAGMTTEQIAARIRPYVLDEDRRELRDLILATTTLDPKRHGQLDPENEAVMQDERYQQWCLARAKEIHALATQCLCALEERTDQQQQADVLLRGSDQTEANPSQTLLRPQYHTESETSPEQLLRPR